MERPPASQACPGAATTMMVLVKVATRRSSPLCWECRRVPHVRFGKGHGGSRPFRA
jgi:hypothetical protein